MPGPDRPAPAPNQMFEQRCSCGRTFIAKSGVSCPYCKGTAQPGDEYTRKTFDFDDTDLKKSR